MTIEFGDQNGNTIDGTSTDDILYGLGGDDVLYGGGGGDQLHGGSGDDDLYGGRGIDTAVFSTAMDVDLQLYGPASSWAPDLGFDRLYGIENAVTGSGDDEVDGNDGANLLSAGAGFDVVHGEGGDDTLLGGSGGDTLEGGFGDDLVRGGGGDDYVGGAEGDDTLEGEGGDDQVDGYLGVDVMTGGAGADGFFVRPGDTGAKLGSRDVITDFSQVEGDRLELHFFDSLEFIGTDPFSAANQVRYAPGGGDTFVQISTNPDAIAEAVIELTGAIALQASDFVL